ncbi:Ig-like domain-containing protein [Reichenbachiella carrageenanivorans]|uniref:Ig-like domain-containing protein n=1 Tax=Reichenbachiella carrageenanivorans TaxID=2979869 RepID=A0ABY6D2P7_9BACT|nr:Ig-like domain-containing protein [Reichenbachiella carrageenanivorans]UXX80426.1 Ig-like domain-containing protein [Reichenbachiella carrageenanivorans]
MKSLFPIFLILLSVYIYSCANQGTPTGGPRDTIPPLLIESTPANKSINFKGQEFKYVFNERVNADKLKSQLLITPHIENKFNLKVKKNELTITFDEKFMDSTTYTLNFSDGVVDVTEKNPAINLSFAFSTGHYIDSIYVNGKITNLYNNENQKDFVVGLYQITDSIDLLKDKPRYFTKTNEQGQFLIENIKNGFYKILTFKDENKNLIFNPDKEAHGFLADSLDLTTSQDSVRIHTQLINASEFKFVRAKLTGRYFDTQYNKSIINYQISKLDSLNELPIPPNNKIKGNQIIRFYPRETFEYDVDSLGILLSTTDSMFNQRIDTTYIKFTETSRKPEKFSASFKPTNGAYIDPLIQYNYTFDKPIETFYKDSILIHYDTLQTQVIADSTILWNQNRTELRFETLIDKDYLTTEIDTLLKIYGDTTLTDSISQAKYAYFTQVNPQAISLTFPKGTFISIEGDSTEAVKHKYQFKTLDQLGSVSGFINTDYKSFTLQLVNSKYDIISEVKDSKTFEFPYVKPGKYTFRVMIDNNEDGQWSYGNILKNETPEDVYFYTEIFDVRANWELENIEISF